MPVESLSRVEDMTSGQCIRTKCFVQDMLGPEYYLSVARFNRQSDGAEIVRCGALRDEVTEIVRCFYVIAGCFLAGDNRICLFVGWFRV